MQTESRELMHFGVKGMRWGVRKGPSSTVSSGVGLRSKIKSKISEHNSKKAKNMTDDDLKTAVNRMRLERDYKDLKKNRTAIGKGSTFVDKMCQNAISGIVVGAAVTIGKDAVMKKLGYGK